ncbi:GNAT family N-acetyltransferase [Streptomyces sp. NPDC006879]|uniref:GNAT family N-acetyltransferase n=1 Tax=Streptomyces sp. NPDC006879 TaxID=3364767 RepID=UPI0036A5EA54
MNSNASTTNASMRGGTWSIGPEPVCGTEGFQLRRAYYAEIASRYWQRPATDAEVAQGLAEDPGEELTPPTGEFLVGRLAGRPAACVGVRMLDATTAELTRVYVRPEARGTGGGAALLVAVEAVARTLGATRLRLDTRSDLIEARRLYARHRYREIPAYNSGRYAEHWFEKHLAAQAPTRPTCVNGSH